LTDRVICVAAHPDDEVLGCGGTLAKYARNGAEVSVIFIADGVSSRTEADTAIVQRRLMAEKALKVIGVSDVHNLGLPDNQLDSLPLLTIVKKLEALLHDLSPNVVFTHHFGDLNIDHQLTARACLTALRPLPDSRVSEILAFEVLSSTEWMFPSVSTFVPNYFVDISSTVEAKLSAAREYTLEMRSPPHARSVDNILNLAKLRGNSVGLHFAEAFSVIRAIKS